MKKRFNVDSPSFTPALPNGTSNIIVAGAGEIGLLGINGTMSKSAGLSPKAASAAPFKPKSIINSTSVNQGISMLFL